MNGTGTSVMALISRLIRGQGVRATFARGAAGAFIGKSLGLAAGFGLQILLARALGVESYGVYVYALTWASVLMYLVALGFDNAVVRYMPAYHADGRHGHARGILRRSTQVALASGIIMGAGMLAAVAAMGPRIEAALADTLRVTAWLMPVFALSTVRQAALRAMRRVFQAEIPDSVLRPALIAAGVALLWRTTQTAPAPVEVMMIQLGASVIALVVGGYLLVRALPAATRAAPAEFLTQEWISMSLPMLFVASLHLILKQTDVVMLGWMSGTTDAGIYSAMVKLSDFAVFGLMAANAIAAPMISELHTRGRSHELQRIITLAAQGATAFTVAVTIALVIWGDWFIGLFGQDFLAGRTALFVLLGGQLVNALTGPVGYLMSMTGHHNRMALIQAVAAAVNVALNAMLIPVYGMVGSAVATAVAMVIWNVWMLVFVRRRLGIRSTVV